MPPLRWPSRPARCSSPSSSVDSQRNRSHPAARRSSASHGPVSALYTRRRPPALTSTPWQGIGWDVITNRNRTWPTAPTPSSRGRNENPAVNSWRDSGFGKQAARYPAVGQLVAQRVDVGEVIWVHVGNH